LVISKGEIHTCLSSFLWYLRKKKGEREKNEKRERKREEGRKKERERKGKVE
jgi:hypothetical protein